MVAGIKYETAARLVTHRQDRFDSRGASAPEEMVATSSPDGGPRPGTAPSCSRGQYVVRYPENEDAGGSLYIGEWAIDSDELYHRHPDEIGCDITGAQGVIEYDVNGRECWKCGAHCPDSIWFAHRLQQL